MYRANKKYRSIRRKLSIISLVQVKEQPDRMVMLRDNSQVEAEVVDRVKEEMVAISSTLGFSTSKIIMSKTLCKVSFQAKASRRRLLTRRPWRSMNLTSGGRISGIREPPAQDTSGTASDHPVRRKPIRPKH